MRFLTGEPYAKRPVPSNMREIPAWLTIELGTIMRGCARVSSRRVTTATTATVNDGLILADATGAPFTIALPDPATVPDMCVTIKRMNGGGNAVTVGGTVDGTLNRTLGSQYSAMTVWSYVPSGAAAAWVRVAVV